MEVRYVAKKFRRGYGISPNGHGPLYAQNYPTKVITVIVPFAAGGPTDTVARRVAVPMSKTLKQQVIVENVGGAGGTIGANRVAKAPADGYTLFLHHIGHSTAPALHRIRGAGVMQRTHSVV
jgi:putative tricarboxylic transport membrane protein